MSMSKNRILSLTLCALFWTWFCTADIAAAPATPEPNPPKVNLGAADVGLPSALSQQAPLAAREWHYHKTADNLHPDGNEQQLIWLMNRARANPSQEGAWLAATGDTDVEDAVSYWGVNLGVLQSEFDTYAAKPPAAFDVRLYHAAKDHADNLIARDAQDHDGQFNLINAHGFYFTQARGIVFSYAQNALYGHAAFNIDWGNDGGDGSGMQPGRGHRMAIMSIDGDYTNVGLAAVAESNPQTEVGPLVITGDFCMANTGYADHENRFLVGTVWQDTNGNDQYDPGEGMAGITVMPDSGAYSAITANSGGYAFPAASSSLLEVTFSGNGIGTAVKRTAAVGSESVLVDLKYSGGSVDEPQAITNPASDVTATSANLNGTVYTNGDNTDYYFQYGPTTGYGNTTGIDTLHADSSVTVVVAGLIEDTTYHFRLVAANSAGTSLGSDRTFKTAASANAGSATPGAPSAGDSGGGGGGGCFILTAADQ